jgi:hypothetical protein
MDFDTPEFRAQLVKDYITQEFHEFFYQELPLARGGAFAVGTVIGANVGDEIIPGGGTAVSGPAGGVALAAWMFQVEIAKQLAKIPIQVAYYKAFNEDSDVQKQVKLCIADRLSGIIEGTFK